MTDPKLTPATRDDLIQALAHALEFQGRRRARGDDGLMANIVAERLADFLEQSRFVVMRKSPAPLPTAAQHPPMPGSG